MTISSDFAHRGVPQQTNLRLELAQPCVRHSQAYAFARSTPRISSFAKNAALSVDANWRRTRRSGDAVLPIIDMFSGCGGMSAGFRSVRGEGQGFRIAGAVDIDDVANRTYELNLGVRPFRASVGDLAAKPSLLRKSIREMLGSQDTPFVLIGCAPCQGFSSHRNEAGTTDSRNNLFLDFAKIAAKIRPVAIVAENVPELLTERYWPLLAEAREILERAGYFVNVSVHNMAEFGVPQERFRIVMLAMTRPFHGPSGFLKRSEFRTVRQAIAHLPRIRAGERVRSDTMHYTAGHKPSTIETIRAVSKDGGNRPENVGPACLRRAKARNGRAVYEDVYGRLFWDRPAITITAYARNPASGRYVHPEQDRGLSIREAALLQSFPGDYTFTGSLDDCFRQIGNAVPPAFAASIGAHVLHELRREDVPNPFDRGIIRPVGTSFSRLIPAIKAGHWKGSSCAEG